jgi:hypothetical protein
VILELTGHAAQQLSHTIEEYQTLRGVKLVVERKSKRPNGRIAITTVPGRIAETTLPPEPDVIATMTHIWGIDEGEGLRIDRNMQQAMKPSQNNGNGQRFSMTEDSQ